VRRPKGDQKAKAKGKAKKTNTKGGEAKVVYENGSRKPALLPVAIVIITSVVDLRAVVC
jgi:hypothetical protein